MSSVLVSIFPPPATRQRRPGFVSFPNLVPHAREGVCGLRCWLEWGFLFVMSAVSCALRVVAILKFQLLKGSAYVLEEIIVRIGFANEHPCNGLQG